MTASAAQSLWQPSAPPSLEELLARPLGAWHLKADLMDLRTLDLAAAEPDPAALDATPSDRQAAAGRLDLVTLREQQQRLPELLGLLAQPPIEPVGDALEAWRARVQTLLLALPDLGWSHTDLGLRIQALRAELIAPQPPISSNVFHLLSDQLAIDTGLTRHTPIRPDRTTVDLVRGSELHVWEIRRRHHLYLECPQLHLFFHRAFDSAEAAAYVGQDLREELARTRKISLHRWRPLAVPADLAARLPPLRLDTPARVVLDGDRLRLWHPHGRLERRALPDLEPSVAAELIRQCLRTWRGLPRAERWTNIPLPGKAARADWLDELLLDVGLDQDLTALEESALVQSHLRLTAGTDEDGARLRRARVRALRAAIVRSIRHHPDEPTAEELVHLRRLLCATRTPIESTPHFRRDPLLDPPNSADLLAQFLQTQGFRHTYDEPLDASDGLVRPYARAWAVLPGILAHLLRAPHRAHDLGRLGTYLRDLAPPAIVLPLLEQPWRDPYHAVLDGRRPLQVPLPPFEPQPSDRQEAA